MPNTTLLGAVGFNPASILIAARHFAIDRALLVATPQTLPQTEALRKQLGVPVEVIALETQEETISGVERRLQPLLGGIGDSDCVVDLTGATKPISIGLWTAAQASPETRRVAVYLRGDGMLQDPLSGESIASDVRIGINDVLAWQGAVAVKTQWQGRPEHVPRRIRERYELGMHVLDAFMAHNACSIGIGNRNAIQFARPRNGVPTPEGFGWSKPGRELKSNVPGYFSRNGWLEELCLVRASRLLAGQSNVLIGIGTTIHETSMNGQDETDVVIIRGSRVCVIEAKARKDASGAGADLQKRIQKTKRFFGSHAQVIFVHPAWNKPALEANQALSGDRVHLVAGDMAALDKAIAQAIGVALPDLQPTG